MHRGLPIETGFENGLEDATLLPVPLDIECGAGTVKRVLTNC